VCQRPVTVYVQIAIHRTYSVQSSPAGASVSDAAQALWPIGNARNDLEGLQAGLDGRSDEHETVVLRDIMHETTLPVFCATDLRQCHPTYPAHIS